MSGPSIISDAQAREIARKVVDRARAADNSPVRLLAETGEISERFAGLGRNIDLLAGGTSLIPNELWAYVAHHGERPAQPGWSSEGSTR